LGDEREHHSARAACLTLIEALLHDDRPAVERALARVAEADAREPAILQD
jgi:hypothetical protein